VRLRRKMRYAKNLRINPRLSQCKIKIEGKQTFG
jgi:hypothetical protein